MSKNVESVVVGASIYKIIYTRNCLVKYGEECYGLHEFEAREIKITTDTDINIQQKEETLVHEVVHAINDDRSLDLKEIQIAGISLGLYQVLRDNKKLFKAFTFGM